MNGPELPQGCATHIQGRCATPEAKARPCRRPLPQCRPSQPLTVTHCREQLSAWSVSHLSSHKPTETVAVLRGGPLSLCRQIVCNSVFKLTEAMGQLGKRQQRSLNQILSGLAESEDCSANSCLSHAGVRASPSPTAGNAAQHLRWAGAGFHELHG